MSTDEDASRPAGGDRQIVVDRVIDGLPDAVAVLIRRLLNEPGLSRQELRRRISGYMVSIESRARELDFIDVHLAQSIADDCHRLIDTLGAAPTEEHRRVVQAAVLYFVMDEDAEGDTTSLIGFDDDRLVVDVVLDEIRRGVPTSGA